MILIINNRLMTRGLTIAHARDKIKMAECEAASSSSCEKRELLPSPGAKSKVWKYSSRQKKFTFGSNETVTKRSVVIPFAYA